MPKISPVITNFTAGEISPWLYGRFDIAKYSNAAKILENILIHQAGGGQRRPGTKYVAAVKTSSAKTRLITFEFSTTQTYIIELGNLYARFYRNRGQIESGGSPYEIVTPYTTAQLFDLQFAQDADTMWIVHPSHKPRKLTRSAHTTWTLTSYAPTADVFTSADNYPSCVAMFEQRIFFANSNTDPQKIWASKSGDLENMTTGTNAGDGFVYEIATDKVNAIRWLKPTAKSLQLGTIGATFSFSSGTDAIAVTPTNVSVKRDTTYGSAKILPEMIGSFIYYVDRDLNHLRELGFSIDIESQQALDMTILADHIAKATDPRDTDGFTQIAYQQSPVSRLWCVRGDGQLAVLTRQIDQEVIGWSRQVAGADTRARGEFESIAIIPTDKGDDEIWVIVKRYIDSSTVRYIEYFMPEDFDHQHDAFFVDSGLSLDSSITISGATVANPVVITATTHGLTTADQIKIVDVKGMTELNGLFYKIIKLTNNTFSLTSTADVATDGSAFTAYISGGEARKMVTSISGLTHLEGETVDICADGAAVSSKLVSGGKITLDAKASIAHVGLGFTSDIQLLPQPEGSATGLAIGKVQRIYGLIIKFYVSLGVKIGAGSLFGYLGAEFGPDEDSLDELTFRTTSTPADQPPPLFTGDKVVEFPGDWDRIGGVLLRQSQPLPLNVLSITILSEIVDD